MRADWLLIPLLLAADAAAATPRTTGIWGRWGAFERAGACYAISEPERTAGRSEGSPFAAISFWRDGRSRGQLHIRLSRAKRPGSALILRVDGRTFQLRGGDREAWAIDAAADAAIARSLRGGSIMSIETRSAAGALIRDHYSLRGAATAIDAAALACRPR